jgi:hypothetical protein
VAVDVTVSVAVGDGSGVLVGGTAVSVGASVAVGVAVGAAGGKKITCPAYKVVSFKQFALKILAMVVPRVRASEDMVSPGCTTYCTQLRGGPQGGVGGGVGGR